MSRSVLMAALAALVTLAGCGVASGGAVSSGDGRETLPSTTTCAAGALPTLARGKLTFGADNPVYAPWFIDNRPENGQGFESAVAYAVADKLGYPADRVAWTRVTFDTAIAPGPKVYDININEFSITDKRKRVVDFSSAYYDVTQAVIALKSSKLADVTSVVGLQDAKLGTQVGTTSHQAISDVIRPAGKPAVYNNSSDAKIALANGTVDGLVVDLPTAFTITDHVKDSMIVGQLPTAPGAPREQFGLVLTKGSKLTPCASRAIDELRESGKLRELAQRWLVGTAEVPELS